MAGNVKFVPPRVPLVDLRTGQITREWYLLFASLFEGADGSGGVPDPVEDTQSSIYLPVDNRTDNIEKMQAIAFPPPDYRAQLEEIVAMIAANPVRDLRMRVDELELMLAGMVANALTRLPTDMQWNLPDEANGDPIPVAGSKRPYLSGGVLKIA